MSSAGSSPARSVTPSPEPQSAPEADRSAEFDSFLDDFDPSDGDNTARVEDASAWLDGSPGGPALSPDATSARPSAGNDSASSLEFATPEFAASASRGLEARGGALDGDASDGDARDDANDANRDDRDADVRERGGGARAVRLSFEDGDVPHGYADVSEGDVSTDVDADADVLSTLDVLASPGAAAARRGRAGGGAGAPPETPAPLRGLGVGPDEWAREALATLGIEQGDASIVEREAREASAETSDAADAADVERNGDASGCLPDDAAGVGPAAPASLRVRAATPVEPAFLVSDAEAEIREMRGAVARMALAEERDETEEATIEATEEATEEARERDEKPLETPNSEAFTRAAEEDGADGASDADEGPGPVETHPEPSPDAPAAAEAPTRFANPDAAFPEAAPRAFLKKAAETAGASADEAVATSPPPRAEAPRISDTAASADTVAVPPLPARAGHPTPALEKEASSSVLEESEALLDDAVEAEAPSSVARDEAARAASAYLEEARRAERAATRKMAELESSLADAAAETETRRLETLADARSAAEASEDADAIAALEREAEEAEAAARAMLAAAARKREAVLAAAAAASAAAAPKPKPVRSPAASSAVRVTSRAPGEDDEGSFEASEETFAESYLRDVPAPVRRSEETIADPPIAAPESPPTADRAASRSPLTTKQALDRVKQARTHRRETTLRRVALERDAVAAELERRAEASLRRGKESEKESALSLASRASPSPSSGTPGTGTGPRAVRASSLGSARRVAARDAVARTRADALEAANAKRVARLEAEREGSASSLASPSPRDQTWRSRATVRAAPPLGRSSLEPPGYLRAIASPATSGSKQKRAVSDESVSPERGSSVSSRPASARRPWGFHAPAEAAEAAARRAAVPLSARAPNGAEAPKRTRASDAEKRAKPETPKSQTRVTPSSRASVSPGRRRVSPLFATRLTSARASLTKLSRASGAAEALLDDGAAVLSALQSRGFDLDELESAWTASPSVRACDDESRDVSRDDESRDDASSKTPMSERFRKKEKENRSSKLMEWKGEGGAFSFGATRDSPRLSARLSPTGTDASTPMSEFERRFMASYASSELSAQTPRTPESIARGRLATAEAKRAAARALDALDAEEEEDFERFFAKYRAESEAAAAKGRAFFHAREHTPAPGRNRRAQRGRHPGLRFGRFWLGAFLGVARARSLRRFGSVRRARR